MIELFFSLLQLWLSPVSGDSQFAIFGSSVSCGAEYEVKPAYRDKPIALSMPASSEEECFRLRDKGRGYYELEKYRQAYDSSKAYVESCHETKGVFFNDIFTTIGASAQQMNPAPFNPDNLVACREWLKKVLYYRSDTNYYCSDVSAIISFTFSYLEGRGFDINAGLAVLKYIEDNNRCPGFFTDADEMWRTGREARYKMWKDTVIDSLATPLDTTLPSLEDIGMDILRGKPASVLHETDVILKRLVSVKASPNPFVNDVALKIDLAASAMLRVDIYDQLGHTMYGEGQGYKPVGEHQIIIGTAAWSPRRVLCAGFHHKRRSEDSKTGKRMTGI